MGKLKDKKAYFHWSKPALLDEACSLNDRVVNLEKELEQAKQQIAELEAKLAEINAQLNSELAHQELLFSRGSYVTHRHNVIKFINRCLSNQEASDGTNIER